MLGSSQWTTAQLIDLVEPNRQGNIEGVLLLGLLISVVVVLAVMWRPGGHR